MSAKISQREAHQWKRRALASEATMRSYRSGWLRNYPENGVWIDTVKLSPTEEKAVSIARRLGHAVIIGEVSGYDANLYALPVVLKGAIQ